MSIQIEHARTKVTVTHGRARATWLALGADDWTEAIVNYLKREYSLMIGQLSADELVHEVGSALPLDEELQAEIRGRDMQSGAPRSIVVTSEEIRDALEPALAQFEKSVRDAFGVHPVRPAQVVVEGRYQLDGLQARLVRALSSDAP